MNDACPACSAGPTGSAGHDALMAHSVGRAGISLRCGRCGSFWLRTTEPAVGFTWLAVSERTAHSACTGIAVPPRTTDPEPRSLSARNDADFARFVSVVLGKPVARSGPRRPARD